MANRHERRAKDAKLRAGLNSAKFRCLACEKPNLKRNKEHYWPKWLIAFAEATQEPLPWLGKNVLADSIQIPLCEDCNSAFGLALENPMSQLLPKISKGQAITDLDCELAVRWLWKFEGLAWTAYHFHDAARHYTSRFSLRERVLGDSSLDGMREQLVVAIALAHRNDSHNLDWSLGIDSGISDHDAIFVSGVFRNVALMVVLADYADAIPPMFSKYRLASKRTTSADNVLQPEFVFPMVSDAEITTVVASRRLKGLHERHAEAANRHASLIVEKKRIEIPHPALRTLR